jgi:hypothetical protein
MTMIQRRVRLLSVACAVSVFAIPAAATHAEAQTTSVDPEALRILGRMTDYVGSLKRFSVHTENMLEEVLESEQKIQYDFSARATIERPDKLRAERAGDLLSQVIVYDGKTLSIHDRLRGYYATESAPDNLDDLLHFARDDLGLVPPTGDIVYTNAFELLAGSVSSAIVVGKSIIGGVRCDHLAFRNPVVDWQIWIADGARPLPYKYVLTTRNDPALPQYIVLMSDWNVAPEVSGDLFRFSPPKGAKKTNFISRKDAGHAAGR